MSSGVLVIDQSFRPVDFVSIREAAEKLVTRQAFAVPGATVIATYHSMSITVDIPSVISLKMYVPIPSKLSRHVTNPLLFARDNYTCQYCGRHVTELPEVKERRRGKSHKSGKNTKVSHRVRKMKLTRDHVKPQCLFKNKEEANTWDNVTTACEECNSIKGDKLPYQSGMYPMTTPKKPIGVLITVYERLTEEQKVFVKQYVRP